MEPDDELDDDARPAGWVDPDDRLWRHPSEVGSARHPARGAGRALARGTDLALWRVAGLAGLIGALLATGILTVAGGLRHPATTIVRPVEQVVVGAATVSTDTGGGVDATVVGIIQRLRPAIVALNVSTAGGETTASGVIYRSDGEILTNNHVIDGASRVQVVLADGRRLAGHVVGGDPDTDVGVVKIDAPGVYPIAALGSAMALKPGEPAIALGLPGGVTGGPSVSVGVISALDRQIDPRNGGPTLLDMIQTDTPIPDGSTGGALLDSTGAVVGITTVIAAANSGNDGFGFATPIDIAKDTADQLVATGKVVHVWIGVEGDDVDNQTAAQLSIRGGAIVKKVRAGTPAASAGLAVRDVIVRIDNQSVLSMGSLVVALRDRKPGDKVSIGYIRDGQWRTVQVTVAVRPKTP